MLLATADWPSPMEAPEHDNSQTVPPKGTPRVPPQVPIVALGLPARTLLTEECVARPGWPRSWKIPA